MKDGFTLIEMLVSVGIFTVVMVVALGGLLAVTEADRRAQSIKTITNNLSFALEGMARSIRTGVDYSCGTWTQGQDCGTSTSGSPGTLFTFTNADGQRVGYRYAACSGIGCIQRNVQGGAAGAWEPITSPEVVIESLEFYLHGSSRNDQFQPRLTISVRGFMPISGGATASDECGNEGVVCSTFDIQTTVTQRLYDR